MVQRSISRITRELHSLWKEYSNSRIRRDIIIMNEFNLLRTSSTGVKSSYFQKRVKDSLSNYGRTNTVRYWQMVKETSHQNDPEIVCSEWELHGHSSPRYVWMYYLRIAAVWYVTWTTNGRGYEKYVTPSYVHPLVCAVWWMSESRNLSPSRAVNANTLQIEYCMSYPAPARRNRSNRNRAYRNAHTHRLHMYTDQHRRAVNTMPKHIQHEHQNYTPSE